MKIDSVSFLVGLVLIAAILYGVFFKQVHEGFRSPWGWRRGPPYGWPGWYRGRWDMHGAAFWRRRWNPVVTWSPWAGWWPERTYVYDQAWATPWDWLGLNQKPWIYYREGFEGEGEGKASAHARQNTVTSNKDDVPLESLNTNAKVSDEDIYNYAPDSPQKADIYNLNMPYRLLQREGTCMPETISGVTSRSCYATDFQRLIELAPNYAQQTNNYKRGAPDSCTAPYHELVLSFYKSEPMKFQGSGQVI